MTAPLSYCDREPIHVPGAIQPYGAVLVFEGGTLTATHGAGDLERILGETAWQGQSAEALLGSALADAVVQLTAAGAIGAPVGTWQAPDGSVFDVIALLSRQALVVEFDPAPPRPMAAAHMLAALEIASAAFERTSGLHPLCQRAAQEFRRLTGFERVMVYRFLGDGSGQVLAEDRDPSALPSFLNHRFPASDIPRQARHLYRRNLVRVIPDVAYVPAPLRPAWDGPEPLDMSDWSLRSVAPVHIDYLKNMGVAASASVSVVLDGDLWGLIACHHTSPRRLPYDARAACRALAGSLSRQIKAKEETDGYRARLRVRGYVDRLAHELDGAESIEAGLSTGTADLRAMLDADGMAILRARRLTTCGICPPDAELKAIGQWVAKQAGVRPFASEHLSTVFPQVSHVTATTSGLLAITISVEEPFVLMWLRAEEVQVLEWAGNPHKDESDPEAVLTPRHSFEAWREVVRGLARSWTAVQIDGAALVRDVLLEAVQNRRLRELNERLQATLGDKDLLLAQKEVLLREVNHRVQNSLQLVSAFLRLQGRSTQDAALRGHLDEAQRRLGAVALVHRRLYRGDQVETIDLGRYIEELGVEMLASMGPDWDGQIAFDLAPVSVATDRAIPVGLILTELVINANKYAYGGKAGPITISLRPEQTRFRLAVSDMGRGKHDPGDGFGTKMMAAMVSQLAGDLDFQNNDPGLRAVLTAPILAPGPR